MITLYGTEHIKRADGAAIFSGVTKFLLNEFKDTLRVCVGYEPGLLATGAKGLWAS